MIRPTFNLGETHYYTATALLGTPNRPPQAARNLFENEVQKEAKSTRTHYSVLKNCAMVRNLSYRDTIKSAGGIFFRSEKFFCRLTSSKFAAAS
jgi:hypothetical protein